MGVMQSYTQTYRMMSFAARMKMSFVSFAWSRNARNASPM
jgi:hypothetical protein